MPDLELLEANKSLELALILSKTYLMLVLNYQVLATDWELSEGLLFEEDTALEAILEETDLDFGKGVDNGSSPRMQEEKRPAEVLCNLRRNSVR